MRTASTLVTLVLGRGPSTFVLSFPSLYSTRWSRVTLRSQEESESLSWSDKALNELKFGFEERQSAPRPTKDVASRPRGRPPFGKTWNQRTGEYEKESPKIYIEGHYSESILAVRNPFSTRPMGPAACITCDRFEQCTFTKLSCNHGHTWSAVHGSPTCFVCPVCSSSNKAKTRQDPVRPMYRAPDLLTLEPDAEPRASLEASLTEDPSEKDTAKVAATPAVKPRKKPAISNSVAKVTRVVNNVTSLLPFDRNASPKSKFRGVFWHPASKKWRVRLINQGKEEYLGVYTDEEEAAAAYAKRSLELKRPAKLAAGEPRQPPSRPPLLSSAAAPRESFRRFGELRKLAEARGGRLVAVGRKTATPPSPPLSSLPPLSSTSLSSSPPPPPTPPQPSKNDRALALRLDAAVVPLNARVLWECGAGHRWASQARNVAKAGTWCPACARAASTWRPSRNGGGGGGGSGGGSGGGVGCGDCGGSGTASTIENQPKGRRRLGIGDMQATAAARGGECLSEEYSGAFGKLQWRCRRGHDFWLTPNRVRTTFDPRWCPECRRIESRRRMQEQNQDGSSLC